VEQNNFKRQPGPAMKQPDIFREQSTLERQQFPGCEDTPAEADHARF